MSYKSVELLKEYLESATNEELEQDLMELEGIEFGGPSLDEMFFLCIGRWPVTNPEWVSVGRSTPFKTAGENNFFLAA